QAGRSGGAGPLSRPGGGTPAPGPGDPTAVLTWVAGDSWTAAGGWWLVVGGQKREPPHSPLTTRPMTRYPSLITGHWSLVFCHRSLVTGHRLAKRAALIASLIATPAPAADLPTLWAEARRVQEAEAARPPDAGPFAPFRPGP